jgi:hypothetical protein
LRIALVTPFSPDIGGGSAQLRCHLRDLPELDVEWHYLATKPAAASHQKWKWLGGRLSFGDLIGDLSARTGFLPGSKSCARQVVEQIQADLYWVVGHYEGICMAAELCDQGKPVHLTVHDDPFGTWQRSRRYRWFQPLLNATFPKLLRHARSIDVTSWGMRNLYRQKYGVNCFSLYLHVPALPQLQIAPDPNRLTVGHIGTLYSLEPFLRFFNACKQIAAEEKRRLRVVCIGSSPELNGLAKGNPEIFESYGDLSEGAAVPLLAACDLLYVMYPPGGKYELFRRTSLPIKLATYVQAQRPVFAHSPTDSGLARIVGPAGVGCVCSSEEENGIASKVRGIVHCAVPRESFEALRQELMGLRQVEQLRAALCGERWQEFPENNFRS